MKQQVLLSPETKRDPTHTKTLQREYTRALVRLFKRFKEQAVGALQYAKISGGNGGGSRVPDMAWFDDRIRDIALSTIIIPGRHITADYVIKSYRAGLKYAGQALKRAGVVPIAPMNQNQPTSATSDLFTLRTDKPIIDALVTNNFSDLRGISDETVKQIIQGMTAAIRKSGGGQQLGCGSGNSLRYLQDDELIDVIDDRVESVGVVRAGALGATNTIAAFSTAEQREYQRNGVERVVWITSGDERVCGICQPLDGEVFSMDETFDPPPLHVMCRCTFVPAVGVEPEIIETPEPEAGATERKIPVITREDISAEDMKKYQEKYPSEIVVPYPIPEKEFADIVSKKANTPEMKELLKDKEVVLIPWGIDARAWTDPTEPKKIFFPLYDINEYDVEGRYKLIAAANHLEKLHPEVKDNKEYQEWRKTLPDATLEDGVEKTLLHENGHLETMDKLEKDGGDPKYRNYFNTKGDNEAPTFFITEVKDYVEVPEVREKLAEVAERNPEAVPYKLGELIAEDYRMMKVPDGKYRFPHSSLGVGDILDPDRVRARQGVLRKIFNW